MARSEAQKRADKKYYSKTYTNISCRIRKELAEKVKDACKDACITPNALISELCRIVAGEPTNDRLVRKYLKKIIEDSEENT